MKKLILAIAVAIVGISAYAQPSYQSVTVNVPSVISAVTNLATPIVIDVRKQQNVMFEFSVGNASTQTNIYTLCRSVSGTSYDTNNTFSLVGTTTGTPRVTTTNLNVQGCGFLILTAVTPYATTATTNILRYGSKPAAP